MDHSILISGHLLLLLSVGVLPFTTTLMAAYLEEGGQIPYALAVALAFASPT